MFGVDDGSNIGVGGSHSFPPPHRNDIAFVYEGQQSNDNGK